jgi:hypothetical protein
MILNYKLLVYTLEYLVFENHLTFSKARPRPKASYNQTLYFIEMQKDYVFLFKGKLKGFYKQHLNLFSFKKILLYTQL